jgi:thiaminase
VKPLSLPFHERLLAATAPERERFLATPILQRALRGDIDKDDYLSFLGQAYHHVRHTVPLLISCGCRLGERHEWLRSAIGVYVNEEMGHEEWILDDIAACGGDPRAAAESPPFPATELMVAYAYDVIHRRNPVGFFGMVLVLEGTSVAIASQAAAVIRQRLKLPGEAFHYLDSHGVLDQSHMRFFEELMNRLADPEDQRMVIHCAGMFYRLYGDIFRAIDERPRTKR